MLYLPNHLRLAVGDRAVVCETDFHGAVVTVLEITAAHGFDFDYFVQIDGVAGIDWMFADWELQPVKGRVK